VAAHLRKDETCADLATGFGIGTTIVFREIHEALQVLAALAPSLHDTVAIATRKVLVILDGTLLRIERVAMGLGRDRPYFSGKHNESRYIAREVGIAVSKEAGARILAGKTDYGGRDGHWGLQYGSPDVSVGRDHAAVRPGRGGQRPPRVSSAMAMRDSGLRP